MSTLVSGDERRRRDRKRKEPQMSREDYESRALERREEARRLAAEGISVRKIATAMRISKSHVQRLVSEDR